MKSCENNDKKRNYKSIKHHLTDRYCQKTETDQLPKINQVFKTLFVSFSFFPT